MSFRDDSSSTFHGGGGYSRSGNPGSNGEVGGGMGGGFGGGGGARNGGFNSSTGLTTGNKMNSSTQRGRPGGISDELAALFKASQPKVGRPNAARPVTQPPLPVYVEPPVVQAPAAAPPKYPVGTLAKAMWDNIFNGPTAPAPVSGVPDEVVPGFGTTYTPPANVSLPTPKGVKAIYDRVPQEPNFPGNKFDQNTGQVGRGKQYSDRVPQGDQFGKK